MKKDIRVTVQVYICDDCGVSCDNTHGIYECLLCKSMFCREECYRSNGRMYSLFYDSKPPRKAYPHEKECYFIEGFFICNNCLKDPPESEGEFIKVLRQLNYQKIRMIKTEKDVHEKSRGLMKTLKELRRCEI